MPRSDSKPVLVTGATGRLDGAALRHLLPKCRLVDPIRADPPYQTIATNGIGKFEHATCPLRLSPPAPKRLMFSSQG